MPSRPFGNSCLIVRVVGDDVDGDFRGPQVLDIGQIGFVVVHKALGPFECLGCRS